MCCDAMTDSIRLTMITVVFNGAERLADTIESVVKQDYNNIEYIIKDGGSTDETISIIKKYAAEYAYIRYISESDDGIYDAMNHALEIATGDVIEFLNSGDRLIENDVVSRAIDVLEETDADIVYGDILYENSDGTVNLRKYPQSCSSRLYYLTGDVINHQAMLVRASLFATKKFDSSFLICGDREWMLGVRAYRPNRKMIALGFTVAIYPLDGMSFINKDQYKKEADACIKKYMLWGYPIYAIFELFRSNKVLAGALHSIYKRLFFEEKR